MPHASSRGRAPMGALSLGLALAVVLFGPALAMAQVLIYDSLGFEPPITTGRLGTYDSSTAGATPTGPAGQQGWLTTDLAQSNFNGQFGIPTSAAGVIQTGTVFAGAQAFQINGANLNNSILNPFSAQTFWYRNFPSPVGAFNPVASGNPLVRLETRELVNVTAPVNTSDMPLVGVYLEGYTATGTQQALTSVLRDLNGAVQVFGPGGASFSTPNNTWSGNVWHDLQVTLNFLTQTFSVTLDGILLPFAPGGVTSVGFRNTNGPTVSLAEYGYQASFNTQAGVTVNNAFFDNFRISATPVPEPSTLLLVGAAAAVGWRVRSRRKQG